MHRPRPLIRVSAFLLASLALLVAGCLGGQFFWHRQHHRYDQPRTGAYYGSVSANLSSSESSFSLYFRGQTATRWYWAFPTNFSYTRLSLEWHRYAGDPAEGKAMLSLPDFKYESSDSTGVLGREVLAGWLLGKTSPVPTNNDTAVVDQMFGYLRAAADGTLPPPNHHGYSFGYESQELLTGRIQHFRLGTGVGSVVYIWIAVWLVATLVSAWVWFRRKEI